MNILRWLIAAIALCAVLAAAGCTTTAPPAGAPATTAPPVAASSLPSLALTAADIPPGFVLTNAAPKNSSTISSLALDLGWQGGYTVLFTKASANPLNETTIMQSIAIYTPASIPSIIGIVDKQERVDPGMVYSTLAAPGIGENSGGYTARANSTLVLGQLSTGTNPLGPATMQASVNQDYAEIWFSKGSVFEVIRVTGPGAVADREIAQAVAAAAFAKIP